MQKRSKYLDMVKGVALILMIGGHCIQYGNGKDFSNVTFFYNSVFKFIYSFHMPLFMLISGYLFLHTVQKKLTLGKFIGNRFKTILLPIIGWQTYDFLLKAIPLVQQKEMEIFNYFIRYIQSWGTAAWFLWAIFYASSVIYIVERFFKDKYWIYVLGLGFTFIVPDVIPNLQYYKFMYPFFIGGYWVAKNIDLIKEKIKQVTLLKTFIVSFVIYGCLFYFWSYDAYIYTSGYTLLWKEDKWYQLLIDVYRIVTGFSGSIFVILGIYIIYHRCSENNRFIEVLSRLGSFSIGIYIVSGKLVEEIMVEHLERFSLNYINNIFQTILIAAASYVIVWILTQIPFLNLILLGGRKLERTHCK